MNVLGGLFYLLPNNIVRCLRLHFRATITNMMHHFIKCLTIFRFYLSSWGLRTEDTIRKDKFTQKSINLFKLRIVKLNSDQFVTSPHLNKKKILITGIVIIIFPEDVTFLGSGFKLQIFSVALSNFCPDIYKRDDCWP